MSQQSLNASPLIQLSKIWVNIDDRDILKAIDFSLQEKEIVTLIGPNGAGKSTLIKVMLGIVKPKSGEIKTARKLKFSYVPQKFNPSHSLPLRVKDLLALENALQLLKLKSFVIPALPSWKIPKFNSFLAVNVNASYWLVPYYVSRIFWYWMNRCRV